MSERRVAVYPASFDPITNGHLDLIHRANRLFDELIVAVAINVKKQSLFSLEERIALVRASIGGLPNVTVDSIDGLLVEYARRKGARFALRGLRALSDFEYEFEMAVMNTHMSPELEHVFLMTSERWFYVSASRIRELAGFGTDVSEFVPDVVNEALKSKIAG